VADEVWEFRVDQSRSRGTNAVEAIVVGEFVLGSLGQSWGKPAEILVGATVKRIESVYPKDRRIRVPGEAVLLLNGVTSEDAPPGAIVRGPAT
jgi:hypothetical protein